MWSEIWLSTIESMSSTRIDWKVADFKDELSIVTRITENANNRRHLNAWSEFVSKECLKSDYFSKYPAKIVANTMEDVLMGLCKLNMDSERSDDCKNESNLTDFSDVEGGISKKLSVVETPNKGRSVIAASPVNENDVLFHENAFAFVPILDADVCNYCCKPLSRFVTCDYCGGRFCDRRCLTEAQSAEHRYECIGAKHDLWKFTGIAQLGFRTFISGSQCEFSADSDPNLFERIKSIKSEYSNVVALCTNLENMHRDDLITYAIVSSLLMRYLMVIYRSGVILESSNVETFIAAMLLKHICQMICNSSTISHESSDDVASAIFYMSSLMNHSCAPNTKITYKNASIIVRAAVNIESGSEVFNCYGCDAKYMSKSMRRDVLKEQYGFTCKCVACLQ